MGLGVHGAATDLHQSNEQLRTPLWFLLLLREFRVIAVAVFHKLG